MFTGTCDAAFELEYFCGRVPRLRDTAAVHCHCEFRNSLFAFSFLPFVNGRAVWIAVLSPYGKDSNSFGVGGSKLLNWNGLSARKKLSNSTLAAHLPTVGPQTRWDFRSINGNQFTLSILQWVYEHSTPTTATKHD
jgi:hypothetical protein